jgi:hypothetical protein
MGVQGAFAYLEAQGIHGDAIDPVLFNGRIHVDVLSLYFPYIISTISSLQLQVYRREPDKSQSADQVRATVFPQPVRAVHSLILRSLPIHSITLHFDGALSTQKNKPHTDRTAKFDATVLETPATATRALGHLQSPPTGQPVRRTVIRRIIRSYKRAIKLWRSAKFLDQEAKTALSAGLQAAGCTVCSCTGEADICIAKLGGPDAVGMLVSRAIDCPGCGQTRDRDHNGATNLALATLSLTRGEGWPLALQRAT